ncbi:ABC transporter permease [Kroppenstedtia pulmonis]|uniref:ABC transporter permease n=1 Tax=Kroppenstedtia pulmonis TaxID=1380685 RepID=A0A7D3XJD3_9BACL|nr:ABC transporter permease [Kroppenstedtia pulmonis]QKG85024.1 ABC transporter permease [Kroppenstedtia pulmonis]
MTKSLYKNTGTLFRFLLWRDRIRIPVWIISLAAITFMVAMAFTDLYPTEQEREVMAETMRNPAMSAMVGQGYGLDHYTPGAMMAHQMLLFTALAVAIMSILLVARHTRADEEDGRIELIRSLPSGRLSNLSATMLLLFTTNALIALVIGFGLYVLNIESMDLEGSLLYGAVLGSTGIIFTAITAIFAQLSDSSRGTIGFSFAVLGLSYLIRAIGDAGNETLSWISPLGWVLGAEVYVNNYWWPIVLTVGVSLLLVIVAFYLNAIRDLGSGFLPAKPGRKHASSLLQSPLGLALRLQRTALIAWAIGLFMIGASYGSVLGDLEAFFEENEIMKQMLTDNEGFSLTEQFITMLMSIMAMISTIPALMSMLKLTGEERKNRTEHLLSRAVSRMRLMGSSLLTAIVTAFVMLSLGTIGLWSTGTAVMDDGILFGTLYPAAIVHLPAMWLMIGIAVLLIGMAPKITGFIWVYLAYSFIAIYLGRLLQFPEWMDHLSPFGYIPQLPVEEMNYMRVSALMIIALVIMMIGFVGYRRRDIQG